MNSPKRETRDKFLLRLNKYLEERCVKEGDKFICKKCGETILQKTVFVSIHSTEFDDMCAGGGEVKKMAIPYCPKCESEPSGFGCIHVPFFPHKLSI